ncbi:MAG TPA: GDP-L-fucose synthase [Bryobacteraceae bacterium]|nr:GDP-L-fucose synthase [Bryobacteraceae bacterium]
MNLQNQTILVTGGAGFLGGHIVEELQQAGCTQVISIRSSDYDLRQASDVSKVFQFYRPDVVIHAAAVVGGIGANRNRPGEFFYDNAVMGLHVIEAARRYRTGKLVVLGTVCAYPKFASVPFSEDDLWNGYPEETNAPYGIAKKSLLVQCQTYRQQFGLNAIYVIPVNLYGPRDHFDLETSHVIPALIRKCVEAQERGASSLELWGDGSATREFIFVRDAARAIVLATRLYEKSDPVNIGTGQEISIADLARLIADLTNFRGEFHWDSSKPNGQPRRCLDISRAQREFGFRASTELREGLSETIAWYRSSRQTIGAS